MAINDYSSQLRLTSQNPLDNKTFFRLLSEMTDYNNNQPFTYYKGLLVYCAEEEKHFIWEEVSSGIEVGPVFFTYPENWVVDGLDYSNKKFYFKEYIISSDETPYLADGFYSGEVTWISGFNFQTTEMSFALGGVLYTVPSTLLTAETSDPTNDRIDSVIGRLNLLTSPPTPSIEFKTGTPAPNPAKPTIEYNGSEIEHTLILFKAGSTGPSDITKIVIYNELLGLPNEYTVTENSGNLGIKLESLEQPNTGLKSIKIDHNILKTGDIITAKAPANFDINTIDQLVFSLYIKERIISITKGNYILIKLFNNSTQVFSEVRVRNGFYGFNSNIENAYQQIIIPITEFTNTIIGMPGTDIDELQISVIGQFSNFLYLDNIEFVSGIGTVGPNQFLAHTDTPNTYFEKAKYKLRVNPSETGVEFVPDNIPFGEMQLFKGSGNTADTLEVGDTLVGWFTATRWVNAVWLDTLADGDLTNDKNYMMLVDVSTI